MAAGFSVRTAADVTMSISEAAAREREIGGKGLPVREWGGG